MDLNELTPELFEKAEFNERRRGYDIDQVERFLEETGTAVAQLLVRHRQLEERASQAETRLAAAEEELQNAKAAPAAPAAPARPVPSPEEEAEEVEQATSTLLMAKRTADATIEEARGDAANVRADASAEAQQIIAQARSEAAAELSAGREKLMQIVTALETRRDSLGAVVEGYEQRIAGYRDQLGAVASALVSMTEDPEAMAARPDVHIPSTAEGSAADDPAIAGAPEQDEVDLTDPTQLHDTATAARADGWGEGSWSDVAPAEPAPVEPEAADAAAPAVDANSRESSVVVDAEPVTGQTSDRFLRELDEAVNESTKDEKGEAISAFFEGGDEEQGRGRFGWRR